MKILSIYNTPVRLERGDLIAVDSEKDRLYIRAVDNLVYVACTRASEIDLGGEIYVSSAGNWEDELHRASISKDIPDLVWGEYGANRK